MPAHKQTAAEAQAQARLRAARAALRTGTALMVLENLRELLREALYARNVSMVQAAEQVGVHKAVLYGFLKGNGLKWDTTLKVVRWVQYGKENDSNGSQT